MSAALLAEVHASIDTQADRVRAYFMETGAGVAEDYPAKVAEARAWANAPDTRTPLLSAQAAAMGIEVAELAAYVLANVTGKGMVAARIESARRTAKQAATRARCPASARAAASINWRAVAGINLRA